MEELIENYGELIRTLSRLQNTNKELLLKSDIERLEKAKTILPKFAQVGAQWERSSHDAHGLNKHDVIKSVCPLCKGTGKMPRLSGKTLVCYKCEGTGQAVL